MMNLSLDQSFSLIHVSVDQVLGRSLIYRLRRSSNLKGGESLDYFNYIYNNIYNIYNYYDYHCNIQLEASLQYV